jgi:hypothetical protein
MATINDFGGLNDPLASPPLGGPQGWAKAVADELVRLGGRITALQNRSDVQGATVQASNGSAVGNRPAGWSKFPLDTVTNPYPALYALNSGGIRVTRAGVYLVTWTITANETSINRLISAIRTGSGEQVSLYGSQASLGAPGFSGTVGFGGARPCTLTAGATVELWAFHDPANPNITPGGAHLELVLIRDGT